MNKLKNKLKTIGTKLASAANWVGSHLGACLTIFSAVAAFLFLRERNKRLDAETTLELDENQDAVNAAKQEVENAQQEADSAYTDYIDAKSSLYSGKRKQKPKPSRAKTGSKKRAAKRK